ncbi:MAG: hypothetical protein OEV86_13910 [Candidatus Krumholzibacteria bacterium]|nr:hypothetical protein [Candidatus Krumholzibacteria bacterium]
MAAYTPATLITTKAFGNGAANISTWRYQNTGGAGTFGIARTTVIETPTAARTVTLQQGTTAADTTAERIADALALTANVPYILNGWYTVANNEYFQGFANSTDINGACYGYSYA